MTQSPTSRQVVGITHDTQEYFEVFWDELNDRFLVVIYPEGYNEPEDPLGDGSPKPEIKHLEFDKVLDLMGFLCTTAYNKEGDLQAKRIEPTLRTDIPYGINGGLFNYYKPTPFVKQIQAHKNNKQKLSEEPKKMLTACMKLRSGMAFSRFFYTKMTTNYPQPDIWDLSEAPEIIPTLKLIVGEDYCERVLPKHDNSFLGRCLFAFIYEKDLKAFSVFAKNPDVLLPRHSGGYYPYQHRTNFIICKNEAFEQPMSAEAIAVMKEISLYSQYLSAKFSV